MKWEIVAHVEEKWTERVPYAENRLPQLSKLGHGIFNWRHVAMALE